MARAPRRPAPGPQEITPEDVPDDAHPGAAAAGDARPAADETYLSVRQAAHYLHLNEKKIYALIQEGKLPGTKVTGKWLFPKKLVDEWVFESTHGGALADRLIVTGSDDPLLAATATQLAAGLGDSALLAYAPVGTRQGLALLSRRMAHACAIHWGPAETAQRNHEKLVAGYRGADEWAIIRVARRAQGVMLRRGLTGIANLGQLARPGLRWAMRQEGSGSHHFFLGQLRQAGLSLISLEVVAEVQTERSAASAVARGVADCAPGCEAAAREFNLQFLPLGAEYLDLVVPRAVFFRHLFQQFLAALTDTSQHSPARDLAGYDLAQVGRVIRGHLPDLAG